MHSRVIFILGLTICMSSQTDIFTDQCSLAVPLWMVVRIERIVCGRNQRDPPLKQQWARFLAVPFIQPLHPFCAVLSSNTGYGVVLEGAMAVYHLHAFVSTGRLSNQQILFFRNNSARELKNFFINIDRFYKLWSVSEIGVGLFQCF